MTRADAVALYTAVRDIKSAGLEREVLTCYIKLRLKLRKLYEEFEQMRQEISEQTKPKDWQEGGDIAEWDKNFKPILLDYMSEEIELNTKILTQEQAIDLVAANPDLPGSVGDVIIGMLCE